LERIEHRCILLAYLWKFPRTRKLQGEHAVPGGRLIAQKLTKSWGQQVIVGDRGEITARRLYAARWHEQHPRDRASL
jgi:hypothetical protein